MPTSPEDFARGLISIACGDALKDLGFKFKSPYTFWLLDTCASGLQRGFANYFGRLIREGVEAEAARDRTVRLIEYFRDRLLEPAMKRRFDTEITPYGSGEPVRSDWKTMHVPLSLSWQEITFEQIQQMITIALQRLRDDLVYESVRTFNDAGEENALQAFSELIDHAD